MAGDRCVGNKRCCARSPDKTSGRQRLGGSELMASVAVWWQERGSFWQARQHPAQPRHAAPGAAPDAAPGAGMTCLVCALLVHEQCVAHEEQGHGGDDGARQLRRGEGRRGRGSACGQAARRVHPPGTQEPATRGAWPLVLPTSGRRQSPPLPHSTPHTPPIPNPRGKRKAAQHLGGKAAGVPADAAAGGAAAGLGVGQQAGAGQQRSCGYHDEHAVGGWVGWGRRASIRAGSNNEGMFCTGQQNKEADCSMLCKRLLAGLDTQLAVLLSARPDPAASSGAATRVQQPAAQPAPCRAGLVSARAAGVSPATRPLLGSAVWPGRPHLICSHCRKVRSLAKKVLGSTRVRTRALARPAPEQGAVRRGRNMTHCGAVEAAPGGLHHSSDTSGSLEKEPARQTMQARP